MVFLLVYIWMTIIISSSHDKSFVEAAMVRLSDHADRSGFSLNSKKTSGPSEEITAFNIRLCHGVMEISDERLLEFQNSINKSSDECHINGVIGYVRTVCPDQADFLASSLIS
jgi:hypothetical protein